MTTSPKYYLMVLGCQMNVSDGERVAALLEDIGYTKTESENEANLIMVLACSVRQSAVDRIYGRLQKWTALKKKQSLVTILSGCVLPLDRKKLTDQFDVIIDSQQILNLPQKLTKLTTLLPVKQTGIYANKYADNYFAIQPHYSNNFQAYVPIMSGCNSFCTYCAVPYTRGREISRPPQEIISEVANLVKHGFKEVTLLGQIVNKYMVRVDDKFISWLNKFLKQNKIAKLPELSASYYTEKKLFKFPQLLAVCASLKGDYWLRYTSPHPKWFSDELVQTLLRYKKIPRHAHLPVQAGHDEVLKKMLRPYTIAEFKKVIKALQKAISDITITTDCIVGFPGETKRHFVATLKLFKDIGFDMAYTAQFSPRAGTVAAKMKDNVSRKEKQWREKKLTDVLRTSALINNLKLINKTIKVLVVSGKKKNNAWQLDGRTEGLKPIRFTTNKNLVGKFIKLKVSEASPWHLSGKLIK